jgi:hypothetical protein
MPPAAPEFRVALLELLRSTPGGQSLGRVAGGGAAVEIERGEVV